MSGVAVGGVVGPNAILQCQPALAALGGRALVQRIYAEAGLLSLLDHPPETMVPQDQAFALHCAIADGLTSDEARQVAKDAGARTGRYILENRIPKLARFALRVMPARLSGPILLRAIERHSWTFAGDADVFQECNPVMRLAILDNPLALGPCHWHRAVMQTIFRSLVSRTARVHEARCCARGDPACIFEITL